MSGIISTYDYLLEKECLHDLFGLYGLSVRQAHRRHRLRREQSAARARAAAQRLRRDGVRPARPRPARRDRRRGRGAGRKIYPWCGLSGASGLRRHLPHTGRAAHRAAAARGGAKRRDPHLRDGGILQSLPVPHHRHHRQRRQDHDIDHHGRAPARAGLHRAPRRQHRHAAL